MRGFFPAIRKKKPSIMELEAIRRKELEEKKAEDKRLREEEKLKEL